jgi:hypothetical protein
MVSGVIGVYFGTPVVWCVTLSVDELGLLQVAVFLAWSVGCAVSWQVMMPPEKAFLAAGCSCVV